MAGMFRALESPMADAPSVHFTQTFKKYTAECRPEVVKHAEAWANTNKLQVYNDNSILKVTGPQERIEALRAELKAKFSWEPIGLEEKKADKKA